ncbi:hypothetical protein ACIBG6_07220 [Streptomyces sp. NPDC050842]
MQVRLNRHRDRLGSALLEDFRDLVDTKNLLVSYSPKKLGFF